MRSLLLNRRSLSVAILGVLFFMLLVVPLPAHAAGGWFDWVPNPLDFILGLALSAVVTTNSLLGQLLNLAKDLLQWVLTLSLELILGLKVIDVAWNVMRDMANLVFVLMLVLISFSTIFNVVKGLQRFHYRTALMPVIIAALMMNFSLAIGKAGVLVFDRVTRVFINIMPNLGADLTKSLQPQAVVLDPKVLVGPLPSSGQAIFDATKNLTTAEDKRYKECLNEKRPIPQGQPGAAGFAVWAYDKVFGSDPGRKSVGDCNLEIVAARQGSYKVLAGQPATPDQEAALAKIKASTPSNDSEQKIFLIFSGVLSAGLILLLTLCLITPCLFLLLRVIMLWVLLFSSPIAWAGYAIPGSTVFRQWWNLFIGWNAFGPTYLFVLIPGMIVLSRSGEMLTALASASASGAVIGTASGLFQILMFNAFAVLIFLGGIAVAMKSSFAGAVKGTAVLGELAGKAGAFDSTGLGGARVAGRGVKAVGRYTGANAYIEAGAERAKQAAAERLQRGRIGRLYQAVKPTSYEEKLAAARSRLGVTGGAKELTDLKAGQIKTAQEDLTKQLYTVPKADQKTYLENRMNSPNRNVALAAREELLKRGLLSKDDIDKTRIMYASAGTGAARAFDERVKTSAGNAAKEKKKASAEDREALVEGINTSVANNNNLPPGDPNRKAPAQLVQETLTQFTDPADRDAAIEALGKKYPEELSSFLATPGGGGMSRRSAIAKAYEPVLKDPASVLKLGPEYFDATGTTNQSRSLRVAVNDLFPKATAGTPAADARYRFQEDLVKKKPSMAREIRSLFS